MTWPTKSPPSKRQWQKMEFKSKICLLSWTRWQSVRKTHQEKKLNLNLHPRRGPIRVSPTIPTCTDLPLRRATVPTPTVIARFAQTPTMCHSRVESTQHTPRVWPPSNGKSCVLYALEIMIPPAKLTSSRVVSATIEPTEQQSVSCMLNRHVNNPTKPRFPTIATSLTSNPPTSFNC